ncbi:MFS transporter [Actinoplanes teichomyceticus]|uniref:MFS transporter n=1 Tax=Actinoplanes teichomyceticus TaxID=1867 RepID=UPI0013DDC83A|nr:MFS transporter [Actinoplanes teichomyceticus]
MVHGQRRPTARQPRKSAPLWRNRDYNLWWSGTALSRLGSSISALALPLLVLAFTGSAAAAGLVGTCAAVGLLAGLLPAGVAADRYPRRRLLAGAALVQAAGAAALCSIAAAGRLWLPLVTALALIQGLASAVFNAAASPLVKRIVAAEQLKAAFTRAEARDYGAQLAGAPLGGLLFTLARWAPFLADALSFVAVALTAVLLRTPLGPDTGEPPDPARTPIRRDLMSGLSHIRRGPFLRYALLWSALTNMLFAGIGFLFVVALRENGASPSTIGAAEAIATGCGLAGTLATEWVVRRVPGDRIVLAVSWMVAAGVGGLVLLADRPWLAALCLGVSIAFVTPLNVVFATRVVTTVPDAMTARVLTSMNLAAMGFAWPAPLLCGVLADAYGADVPLIAIAAGLAVMAVVNHLAPAVRQLAAEPGARNPATAG